MPRVAIRGIVFLSRLRSRFTWSGASTDGRVQAAITKLSAAISGARRRPRSAITSPSASPSRSHCRSVSPPAAATSRAASSGARSNTACSAWPGPVKTLLRRRAPSSTKPSSSAVAHHRTGPVEPEQRDQRAVAARPSRRPRRAGKTPLPAAGNSPAAFFGPPSSAAAHPRSRHTLKMAAGKASKRALPTPS